ncbi:MAG: dihydroneopterin aldolase [Dokdonia sp.]|jgi:dihydroneopterin aldolase
MGIVEVNDIRLRAFHGCIEEEAMVGGEFSIHVKVHAPFAKAAQTDDLNEAIDYVVITEIVKKEMTIRAKLIEVVAMRIVKSIQKRYSTTTEVEVKLIKHRAPIQSDVKNVSVYLSSKDLS